MDYTHDQLMRIGRCVHSLCRKGGKLPVDAWEITFDQFEIPEDDRNKIILAVKAIEEEARRPIPQQSKAKGGWTRTNEPPPIVDDARMRAANDDTLKKE